MRKKLQKKNSRLNSSPIKFIKYLGIFMIRGAAKSRTDHIISQTKPSGLKMPTHRRYAAVQLKTTILTTTHYASIDPSSTGVTIISSRPKNLNSSSPPKAIIYESLTYVSTSKLGRPYSTNGCYIFFSFF